MIRKAIAEILLTLLLINVLALMHTTWIVKAQSETIYIRPDGAIDPPSAPIIRVGNIYTFTNNIYETIVVQRDNIIVDGDGYMLQGAGSDTGFELSNRNNVTIKKTYIREFDYGIRLYKSSSCTIRNNNLTHNVWSGIFVSNSSSNIISENTVVNNVREGISLWLTNTTTVTGNNVSSNGEDGISIGYSSFNNTINNNTVFNNSWAGISLPFENSTSNMIIGNNVISNNWTGIYIDHSSDNILYHNNILHNWRQTVTIESTNVWDNGYPSGGNYWSDYTGLDLDGDGIGDTPYTIDAYNQDNYPFMNPWTPQAYDIATVNVTPSKTVAGQGYPLHINVTVTNQGSYTQTFNVTVYANSTTIQTQTVILSSGSSTTITFNWDTTGFAYGDYTTIAVADTVPGEIDTADNTYTNGIIMITIPGDVNGDRTVDIFDIGYISAHWYPGPPVGPSGYDTNADINDDSAVNIFDIGITSANWGQSW